MRRGILPLLALLVGVLLGLKIPIVLPLVYGRYLSIALLAALDSVFGGLRAGLEHRFDTTTFVTGFFTNTLLAGFLTYMGDILGVPLFYAALFAFGFRLFQNLGAIRHDLLGRLHIPEEIEWGGDKKKREKLQSDEFTPKG